MDSYIKEIINKHVDNAKYYNDKLIGNNIINLEDIKTNIEQIEEYRADIQKKYYKPMACFRVVFSTINDNNWWHHQNNRIWTFYSSLEFVR